MIGYHRRHDRQAEARAAATLWQERARVLEGRLLQLTAGDIVEPPPAPEPVTIAPGSTETSETPST